MCWSSVRESHLEFGLNCLLSQLASVSPASQDSKMDDTAKFLEYFLRKAQRREMLRIMAVAVLWGLSLIYSGESIHCDSHGPSEAHLSCTRWLAPSQFPLPSPGQSMRTVLNREGSPLSN